MNPISIATRVDIPELVKLVNSAYRGESSKKGWTTEADLLDGIRTDEEGMGELIDKDGSVMLKCEDRDSNLIGCVNLQDQDGKLYLGMLTVSPGLQGSGIGKQLLAAAEEYAVNNGFGKIVMTVISVRKELIDWYKRKGYNVTLEKKPFPLDNPKFGIPRQFLEFIVMEKKL